MIDVDVGGYPFPMVLSERVSGGSVVGSSVSASMSMISIQNINRVDSGTYRFTYSNTQGAINLTLILVIECKLKNKCHKIPPTSPT